MSFMDDIQEYTDDELDLIIETQKELYSAEEWLQLQNLKSERVRIKREEYEHWVATRIPETIVCEKCDGPNPFANEVCTFCGHKLDKAKYYTDAYYESVEREEQEDAIEIDPVRESYTFHYIISFLIPFVGFIMGAVMLAGDSMEKRTRGKTCIVTAIVSFLINVILLSFLW